MNCVEPEVRVAFQRPVPPSVSVAARWRRRRRRCRRRRQQQQQQPHGRNPSHGQEFHSSFLFFSLILSLSPGSPPPRPVFVVPIGRLFILHPLPLPRSSSGSEFPCPV